MNIIAISSFIILLLLTLQDNRCHAGKKKKKVLLLQKVVDCSTNRSNNGNINKIELSSISRGKIAVSAWYDVHTDLQPPIKMSIKVNRCKGNIGKTWTHCEFFTTINFNDVCSILDQKYMFWHDIYTKVQPKVTCPVRKGTYSLKNYTIPHFVQSMFINMVNIEDDSMIADVALRNSKGDILICIKIYVLNTYIAA